MRLKGQIPAEANRGFSVISEEHLTPDSAKEGEGGRQIETTNQARNPTANYPAVSRGINGQAAEQAA